MNNVRCRYVTEFSIDDCIGLINRRNIYDVFEYNIETIDKNHYFITFTNCLAHYSRNIKTKYRIEMVENKETYIYLSFVSEFMFIPVPLIPRKWIDEFMEKKLSAYPKEL